LLDRQLHGKSNYLLMARHALLNKYQVIFSQVRLPGFSIASSQLPGKFLTGIFLIIH